MENLNLDQCPGCGSPKPSYYSDDWPKGAAPCLHPYHMTKTMEESFIDWEGSTFGYGYGTGEPHIIPALQRFLSLCPRAGYDHAVLEAELTPTVAWLLINRLCGVDILEYGTSPRYGWLTPKGERLKEFCVSRSADELVKLATRFDHEYDPCTPDCCNCGPQGYQAGVKCLNPFWSK